MSQIKDLQCHLKTVGCVRRSRAPVLKLVRYAFANAPYILFQIILKDVPAIVLNEFPAKGREWKSITTRMAGGLDSPQRGRQEHKVSS